MTEIGYILSVVWFSREQYHRNLIQITIQKHGYTTLLSVLIEVTIIVGHIQYPT